MTQTWEELKAQIAELEKKATVLEKDAQERRKARREACRRQWKFTVSRITGRSATVRSRECLDPTMETVRIEGTVMNREECLAAGWAEDTVRNGGMDYIYNPASHHLVIACGGGMIFIGDSMFAVSDDAKRVSGEIGQFLEKHPEGGDITEIILKQERFGWR